VVDERDVPVAEVVEVLHRVVHGLLEVDVGVGQAGRIGGPPDHRQWPPCGGQGLHPVVFEAHLHQQHAVDQPVAGHGLDVGPVVEPGRPYHDVVAELLGRLDRTGHAVEVGPAQPSPLGRQRHRDDARPARGERPGYGVRPVAEGVHRLLDARPGRSRDRAGAVDGVRDRAHRHTGGAGDVFHRGQ
jgi:hypothetical protein